MHQGHRSAFGLLAVLCLATAVPCQAPYPAHRLFGPRLRPETYMVDTNGQVVHTWSSNFKPGLNAYMLPDGSLLRSVDIGFGPPGVQGGWGGGVQRVAFDGTLLWDFRFASAAGWAHHDIEPMPNGNVLIIAWEDFSAQEAVDHGRNPAWVTNVFRPDQIVEVKPTGPTTGDIVWEWHLWDHLVQDFDPTKANYGVISDNPHLLDINQPPVGLPRDWNHCNSVDYDPMHDWVIVSSRHNNEIWIIDHSTTTAEAAGHTGGNYGMGGDILWRWGNPETYGRGTPADRKLFAQHCATFIPQGCPGAGNILLYNNQVPGGFSRVEELVLPLDSMGRFILPPGGTYGPTAPVWTHSQGVASPYLSSARRAPNGNTLICNGFPGSMLEVTQSGQQVWSLSTTYQIFQVHYAETDLWTDRTSLPSAQGGTVNFDLVAGSAHAGDSYLLLGSLSGTSPGTRIHGKVLPLMLDAYSEAMITGANALPFGQNLGTLDANGRATSTLSLPPLPFLSGLHLDHAFVTINPSTSRVTRASNAVPLDLLP